MAENRPTPPGFASATIAEEAPAPAPKGNIRSFRVEPAEGGFIVTVDRESSGRELPPMPKPRVVSDLAALHAAIDEAFGGGAAPAMPPMPVAEEKAQLDVYESPAARSGGIASAEFEEEEAPV